MKALIKRAAGVLLGTMVASTICVSAVAAPTPGGLGDGNGDGYADLYETVQDGRYITSPQANGVTWFRPSRPGKTPIYNAQAPGMTLFTDWNKTVRANVGLGSASAMVALPDVTGDKKADAMVRFGSHLYLYTNRGDGIPVRSFEIGHGWGAMDTVIYAGSLNGDAKQYLLARRSTDQSLWAYELLAGGRVRDVGRVGLNWGKMRFLLGVGQMVGDNKADLVGISSTGDMWCYRGIGGGRISDGTKCGHGWNGFQKVFVPGDVNGDGTYDIAGYKPPTKATRTGEPDLAAWGLPVTGDSLAKLKYQDRGPVYLYPNLGNANWGSNIMWSYDDFQFFLFA